MTNSGHKVFMVGAFPPPVHGMAVINSAVCDVLRQAGVLPVVINLAASSLDRSWGARVKRLPRVFGGLGRLAVARDARGGALYMSVSGGFGQVYELLFLLIARLRRMRVFLHHHSFAYLDNRGALTQALVIAGGKDAVHVALSPGMAKRLKEAYGVPRLVPVSNTVFLTETRKTVEQPRQSVATLGFIGNISGEKGVFEFVDLMDAVADNGCALNGKLAGPFQDAQVERVVGDRLRSLPHVKYIGPQYGTGKDAFYKSIDVLIFPTRYINEAEPITVYEAMCRGIPVIAYGRGCIPEMIGSDCGLVIDPADPFVPAALAQLQRWSADASSFQAASKAAAARFAQSYEENMGRWQVLLGDIAGNGNERKA